MYNTPILFLIYNREELALKVFASIREIRPRTLFVACDGARKHIDGDEGKVQRCRDIIKQIDWPCKVETRFLDENVGSRKAIADSITWFMQANDCGVILEDDCVPAPQFFEFAQEMLDEHRDDQRIAMIAGTSYRSNLDAASAGDASYLYSRYCHIWGWATWSTKWLEHVRNSSTSRSNLERLELAFNNAQIKNPVIRWFWARTFRNRVFNPSPSWDYNWMLSCWEKSWLAIIPRVNLVSNLGHGPEATRTTSEDAYASNMQTHVLPKPYRAPNEVKRNESYDRFYDWRIIVLDWMVFHELRKLKKSTMALFRAK